MASGGHCSCRAAPLWVFSLAWSRRRSFPACPLKLAFVWKRGSICRRNHFGSGDFSLPSKSDCQLRSLVFPCAGHTRTVLTGGNRRKRCQCLNRSSNITRSPRAWLVGLRRSLAGLLDGRQRGRDAGNARLAHISLLSEVMQFRPHQGTCDSPIAPRRNLLHRF